MKKNTKLYLIGIICLIILFTICAIPNYVKATDVNPNLYVGIKEFREGTTPSGMGYAINNPIVNQSDAESKVGEKIWKLVKYANNTDTNADTSTTFYCVKAGIGFTDTNTRAVYNKSYDFLKERTAINNTNNKTLQSIVTTQNDIYWGIVALADLVYIPESSTEQDQIKLLIDAGIFNNVEEAEAAFANEEMRKLIPTKDDIDAVQQAAFWYYTNSDDAQLYEKIYNKYNKDNWFFYRTEEMAKKDYPEDVYRALSDYEKAGGENKGAGYWREEFAKRLYNYLIGKSQENISNYKNGTMVSKNKITLYTNGADENLDKANTQPIITIEKNKPFDLALRKYITKVGNVVLADAGQSRKPVIDESTITEKGTATYKHKKQPYTVKTGDIITYNITIYNEGEKEGRATKIVDQLPEGLKFKKLNTEGFVVTYEEGTNTVQFLREEDNTTNLKVYEKGKLEENSETLEFECEVSATASLENTKVLTNVAWIAEEYNAEDNLVITTTEGDDRDSTPGQTPPDVNKDNIADYKGTTTETDLSKDIYYPGYEDDDDFEKLEVKPNNFDLALRKFIIAISKDTAIAEDEYLKNSDGTYTRAPHVDTSKLNTIVNNEFITTAIYKHPKIPVVVNKGDTIVYMLRVYNEGMVDGYASEIKDYLPEGLDFVSGEFNNTYGWEYDEQTRIATTDYLKDSEIKATTLAGNNTTLNYKEVPIMCKINNNAGTNVAQTNIAEISESRDKDKQVVEDRDSQVDDINIPEESEKPTYKDDQKGEYIPGDEDDDDFEKVIVSSGKFDLALRKFITKVEDKVIDTRIPQVKYSKGNNQITYEHSKEPVDVLTGNIVTYTIRVYNEGECNGYASQILDDIPEGLEYLPENETNTEYRWEMYRKLREGESHTGEAGTTIIQDGKTYIKTTDVKEAEVIVTDYLSKEQGEARMKDKTDSSEENPALLKAFDPEKEISNTNPDYKDVKVAFKVAEPKESDRTIINKAQISEDTDEDGNEIDDKDSKPGEWNEGEDDQDKEYIRVNYFDLALRKFIIAVSNDTNIQEKDYMKNSDGTYTREPQVDTSKLNTLDEEGKRITTAIYKHSKEPVQIKKNNIIVYMLRVYNEAQIEGTATKISDYLPEGLEFVKGEFNDKYGWEYDEQKRVATTTYLKDEKIKGVTVNEQNELKLDYKEVPIMCKVQSNVKTDVVQTNLAEITESKNDKNEPDRDSDPDNLNIPKEEDKPTYKEDKTGDYIPGDQDDDDFEKVIIVPGKFDLALRKFITKVEDKVIDTRIPKVKYDKENDKITYEHSKDSLGVVTGDVVTYTIRVYNEGECNGYASQILDDIPEGLEYLPENKTNTEYRWKMYRKLREGESHTEEAGTTIIQDGKTYVKTTDIKEAEVIVTDYLSKEQGEARMKDKTDSSEENPALLKAFDPEKEISNTNPDYKDVQVAFKVVEPKDPNKVIVNKAQISEDTDENGDKIDDKDSKPGEWNEGEDDQDEEYIKINNFDLALRKFVTKVENQEINTRIPQVKYNKESNQITYEHSKEPVEVVTGNIMTYTIRVYNEGGRNGYAAQIVDNIPEGLEYLPEHETNSTYRWEMYRKVKSGENIEQSDKTVIQDGETYIRTGNVNEAEIIVTDYLSKEQGEARMSDSEKESGENPALLKAFNPEQEISETNPHYKDVQVAFKVGETNASDKVIINSAQVSKNTDEDGNEIEDEDSKPGEWNEGEDDQDREYIKLTYFDLSLKKWVTQSIVIEDGRETVRQTGYTPDQNPEPIVKVEVHRKKLDSVIVKFRFAIRVTNEGDIAGYAKEITDYVPEGLRFIQEDNPGWLDQGNNLVTTTLLADKLLQPGESADVEIVLTWINGSSNMGLKTNVAEITKDYNDKGAPDRDSIPGNRNPGEDDMDDAPVMLSIKTGQVKTYIALGFSSLITMAGGLTFIKKYVL